VRPGDIDRTDRRRLLSSLAVTAVFYILLFSALLAFGVPIPAGGASPGRKGSTPISIRLAAEGGTGAVGTDSVRRGSRRAEASAPASPHPQTNTELTADAAALRSAAVEDPDRTAAADQGSGIGEKSTGDEAVGGTAADDGGDAGNGGAVADTGDGTGSGSSIGGTNGGTPAFISWLDQAIRTKLAYPEKARNRNIEGTVTILAEVSADGKKCRANVAQSSGSSILDRAAVSFVKSLFPSPVSPRKTFSGTLRIRYILTQEGT